MASCNRVSQICNAANLESGSYKQSPVAGYEYCGKPVRQSNGIKRGNRCNLVNAKNGATVVSFAGTDTSQYFDLGQDLAIGVEYEGA
jgi:hypothetical protein